MKVRRDFPRGLTDQELEEEIIRAAKELSVLSEQALMNVPVVAPLLQLAIAEREYRRAALSRRSSFVVSLVSLAVAFTALGVSVFSMVGN